MDAEDEIRARIRQRLDETGLAVKTASVKAGLGETTLRNYLEGMTRSMTVENLRKLALALEVSFVWLADGKVGRMADLMERVMPDNRDSAIAMLRSLGPQ